MKENETMNTKITRPAVALLTAACVGTAEIQPGHEAKDPHPIHEERSEPRPVGLQTMPVTVTSAVLSVSIRTL
jgi:hypothetical protein